jgi:hypothetical protein
MAKKNGFWAILAIALAAGTVLLGCPTEPEEEKDTWSNITNLNQIDGTWKGSYSQTQNIKDFIGEENWNDQIAALFGDMKVNTTAEITITIKATDKKQSTSIKATMTFSGGNITTVWAMLKESLDYEGITTNDTDHSMSMTYEQSEQSMTDDDISEMLNSLQINQKGTKIKIPSETMGAGLSELIMNKQ